LVWGRVIADQHFMGDEMKKFIISAASYEDAVKMAKTRNIPPRGWIYAPEDKKLRLMALSAHHGFPRENLIGNFSEEEIIYLTITVPKKDEIDPNPEIVENRAKTTISITSDSGLGETNDEKRKTNPPA